MAASTAVPAFGTLFKMFSGGSYATIIQTGNFEGPGETNEMRDVTSHTSPGRKREWLATLADNEAMTVPLFFDPTDPVHIALRAACRAQSNVSFQVVVAGSLETDTFNAFVSRFRRQHNVADPLMATFELRPTGVITTT